MIISIKNNWISIFQHYFYLSAFEAQDHFVLQVGVVLKLHLHLASLLCRLLPPFLPGPDLPNYLVFPHLHGDACDLCVSVPDLLLGAIAHVPEGPGGEGVVGDAPAGGAVAHLLAAVVDQHADLDEIVLDVDFNGDLRAEPHEVPGHQVLPADLPVRRPDVAGELEGVVLAEQEPPALPGQLALRPLPLGDLAAEPGDIPPPQPARLVYDGYEPVYLS